jgi:signal transduction histidine kinase
VLLLVLLAGATAGFVWRGHARHVDRQEMVERRRAEEAVQRSETHLRSLLGAMTEMVVLHEIVLDAGGRAVDYRILDCNAAFTAATGITREKAVGALASGLYGAGTAPYLAEYAEVAATGVPKRFEVHFPPLRKYFEISAFSPQTGRFGTVTSDITARRQGEEERARLNRELTFKNQELEDIIYVASHDLRAPLINVLGFGERLGQELPALLAPIAKAGAPEPQLGRVERALGHIRASAMRMDALLRGLLRVSRLGREELRPVRLEAGEMIRGVLATLAHQVETTGAQVNIGDLPPCLGDAQQISQVFANLIDNALKYRAAERALVLQISGQVTDAEVVYCFADNGLGIAAEHQERIWEMFHRLQPGAAVAGEGLGLCIVRRIVIRHRGRAWVESSPGAGSRFFVALPVAA